MSALPPQSWNYLAPNPKSSYKQLFVRGTRITARTLYGWYAGPEPMTPEFIAEQFNLPVEAVLESIAYCESNPPELLEDYAVEQALVDAMQRSPNGRIAPQEVARIRREYRTPPS
jgi:uncharacterized protein (DUF433 family)